MSDKKLHVLFVYIMVFFVLCVKAVADPVSWLKTIRFLMLQLM